MRGLLTVCRISYSLCCISMPLPVYGFACLSSVCDQNHNFNMCTQWCMRVVLWPCHEALNTSFAPCCTILPLQAEHIYVSDHFNSKCGKCATSYQVKKNTQTFYKVFQSRRKLENGFFDLPM